MTFRWFGLYCTLLGMVACASIPENSVKHHSKKPAPVYVGLKTPPLPPGHETELGYLLRTKGQSRYAIEVVSFGSKKIVWLGQLLYHDERGRAHWKIIAALPPQQLPADYQFSGGNCSNDNILQPEIVAILRMKKEKALTRIHKAWKAVPDRETFEPLDLEGIQCDNERFNH